MSDYDKEYCEYEQQIISKSYLAFDMAKKWHELDDCIDKFVYAHGTNTLSFVLGGFAAISLVAGLLLPFTGKLLLIILGHLLVVLSFVLAYITHRAGKVFKLKLAESVFYSFSYKSMIDNHVYREKEKEMSERSNNVRMLTYRLDTYAQQLATCDPSDCEKYCAIVEELARMACEYEQLSSYHLSHDYDRLASDLKNSGRIRSIVKKIYPQTY